MFEEFVRSHAPLLVVMLAVFAAAGWFAAFLNLHYWKQFETLAARHAAYGQALNNMLGFPRNECCDMAPVMDILAGSRYRIAANQMDSLFGDLIKDWQRTFPHRYKIGLVFAAICQRLAETCRLGEHGNIHLVFDSKTEPAAVAQMRDTGSSTMHFIHSVGTVTSLPQQSFTAAFRVLFDGRRSSAGPLEPVITLYTKAWDAVKVPAEADKA